MPATPRKRRRTTAKRADKYTLYQLAVQSVDAEIDFVDRVYTKRRGKRATLLREDFCGTANTACEWVRRRAANRAVGVDIDPVPMDWGRKHNLTKLTGDQRRRLQLRRADVLKAGPFTQPGARRRGYDAVLAMNFSFWCFKARQTMLRYYRAVHASLAADGIFFLDFYGGPDALREYQERRRINIDPQHKDITPFTYVWDQRRYDPITGDITCSIHFRFPDGSEKKHAFRYDWRLWTIPEIRDILADAGFKNSTVYWEGDAENGGGNGIFRAAQHGEACPAFIAYIVAEK